tara:strand:+ start:1350 stop:1577 length:228 start_codon:yes stop_codon:yes gene_type:complete
LSGVEKDAHRAGRKDSVRETKEAVFISKATQETPVNATQWSIRTMAADVGVSLNRSESLAGQWSQATSNQIVQGL